MEYLAKTVKRLPYGHIEEVRYALEKIKYIDSLFVELSAKRNERIRVIFCENITDIKQGEFNYGPYTDEDDKLEWFSIKDISKVNEIYYT